VELDQDPEYLRRVAAGEVEGPGQAGGAGGEAEKVLPPKAALSAWMFLLGVAVVVCCGLFPALRKVGGDAPLAGAVPVSMPATMPEVTEAASASETTADAVAATTTMRAASAPAVATAPAAKKVTVSMPMTIAIIMLALAAMMLLFTKTSAVAIVKTKTCSAGLTAVVGILGLAWLGDTFIQDNKVAIVGGLTTMAEAYPSLFSVGLFVTSMLLYSQAATTQTLMPLGLTLGLKPAVLAGMFPAVNGYFFIPTYGTLIAAVNFDRSGTTRIGKYVLNHSFMIPGIVATVVAVATGITIGKLFF